LAALAVRRAMDASWQRWRRALEDFEVDRILITAELMGVPIREVTPALMAYCHVLHGAPPPYWARPAQPGIHHMTMRYVQRRQPPPGPPPVWAAADQVAPG
jgi:hypothetical protein